VIGEINPQHFENIFPMLTNEVIITNTQIEHIRQRHPMDYERFAGYIPCILQYPNFIVEANKPNSVVFLSRFENDECFRLILRLLTHEDKADYSNSIISFWKINRRRYDNYVRNSKILYSKE